MLPGDKCSGVSELAEGYTYMRGRCKQLGGLQIGDREERECLSGSDYESIILNEGLFHRSESFDQRSEDICRRISMSAGDANRNGTTALNEIIDRTTTTAYHKERRVSRDIGTQAYSIEFENERTNRRLSVPRPSISTGTDTRDDDATFCRKNSDIGIGTSSCNHSNIFREHSLFARRESCHYHQQVCPSEVILTHCPNSTFNSEYLGNDNVHLCYGHDSNHIRNYVDIPPESCSRLKYAYPEHPNSIIVNDEQNLEPCFSTCSSDSSTVNKYILENISAETIRKSKSGMVFLMDPCIEDSTEYADEEVDETREQSKPLIDVSKSADPKYGFRKNSSLEKRNSFMRKSMDDTTHRSTERFATTNVDGIDLANNQEVCPFGLAKNLEKQICIIPSRKKSSGRLSPLKVITFILIGSAILITSAAIKEAYY